jgi:hypothetical protein
MDVFRSWAVVIALFLACTSNNHQGFLIGATYNFKLDDGVQDPYYMISAAIPGFTQEEFGFISGFAYTSVFVCTVFVAGIVADNCQRRLIVGLAVMLWSACSITTALSTTLFQVKASRMFLGLF